MIFKKYNGRKAFGLLTFLLLSGTASVAHSETLEQAVMAALNHHPSVQAAMANRDAYIEERKEQFSGYFPQLSVRTAAGRVYGDNSTSRGLTVDRGAGYSGYGEGSVSLTQMLFDGFEVSNKVDAAQARRNSANYSIVDVREDLALRTVLTYLGILRGRESLAKIDAHLVKIRDFHARLENMVAEGAADETQAVLAKDIEIQLKNTRADVEAQMYSAMAEYQEITGLPVTADLSMPVLDDGLVDAKADEAVLWARKHHPALIAASLSEEAVAREIDVEKAAYYPDVSGELSYLKSDKQDILGGELEDGKALLRMNWDFSTGGGTAARVRKTQYRLKESQARYNDAARQIERDVKQAYNDMERLADQKALLNERRDIHAQLLANYEVQFEGALVSLLQMLQANNSLFSADLGAMNGDYSYLASRYALLASMGRLQNSLNIVSQDRDE